MESEVIAALIGTPAVLVTAFAAWAAGRASGQGAHRGPIDAIRRSAQRDAYASFLKASRHLSKAADTGNALQRNRHPNVDNGEVHQASKALVAAADLVLLEGPDGPAAAAQRVVRLGLSVCGASVVWNNPHGPPTRRDMALALEYEEAITHFIAEARHHLNGTEATP